MIFATLQQWIPAAALVAAHRLTNPAVLARVWSVLKRAKKDAPAVRAALDAEYEAARDMLTDPASFDTPPNAPAVTPVAPSKPTENQTMSFKFALNLGKLAQAMAAAQNFDERDRAMFAYGARVIDIVEQVYTADSGLGKKAAVLAAVQAFGDAGFDSNVHPGFEAFLESVIGAYNAANAVVNADPVEVDPAPIITAAAAFEQHAAKIADAVFADATFEQHAAKIADAVFAVAMPAAALPALRPLSAPMQYAAVNTVGV